MENNMYRYKAKYLNNYDGDTIDFEIDLGFNIKVKIRVRLARVDTPELRGNTYEEGIVAKNFVKKALENASVITVETFKDKKGKYGRYIAEVYYNGRNLSDELLKHDLATIYGD